jgi:hypothetical protein
MMAGGKRAHRPGLVDHADIQCGRRIAATVMVATHQQAFQRCMASAPQRQFDQQQAWMRTPRITKDRLKHQLRRLVMVNKTTAQIFTRRTVTPG